MAKPAIAGKGLVSPCDVSPLPMDCALAQVVGHLRLGDRKQILLSVRACAYCERRIARGLPQFVISKVFHLMRAVARLSGPLAPGRAPATYFRLFFVEGSICEG